MGVRCRRARPAHRRIPICHCKGYTNSTSSRGRAVHPQPLRPLKNRAPRMASGEPPPRSLGTSVRAQRHHPGHRHHLLPRPPARVRTHIMLRVPPMRLNLLPDPMRPRERLFFLLFLCAVIAVITEMNVSGLIRPAKRTRWFLFRQASPVTQPGCAANRPGWPPRLLDHFLANAFHFTLRLHSFFTYYGL
jgi:hypothetical protein